jgi:histidine kinase/DNA gyrase B/HSP90-like ATPase
MSQSKARQIDIQPGVSVLSVLRYLNYQPWYALAEFVDNSMQSALDHSADLRRFDGPAFRVKVDIEYTPADTGRIVVRDNAAGIHNRDYERAFKTAERPPDVGNLAEFGMGMKSAACWFARTWSVRTKALGEREERLVSFDIDEIVRKGITRLSVQRQPAPSGQHYTEVVLTNLHRPLGPKTISKVKTHLAAIYRVFMREHVLTLMYNGDELQYLDPTILKAAVYRNADGQKRFWRKDFDIRLPNHRRIHGFAALRETASTSEAGLAVFRRRRLIQGGADQGYRPEHIFKKPNSYTYQRLFGEMHVEGFGVSHTKDAIQWDGQEDEVVERLAADLNKPPLVLLDQAEGYRVRPPKKDVKRNTEAVLDQVLAVGGELANDVARLAEPRREAETPRQLKPALKPFTRDLRLELPSGTWEVRVEAVNDPAIGDWVSVSDQPPSAPKASRRVTIRVGLAHPFMDTFVGPGAEALEPLVRIAIGIGLAELSARDAGVRGAGAIRTRLNELLRGSLSQQG